jgi:hypothetical protein
VNGEKCVYIGAITEKIYGGYPGRGGEKCITIGFDANTTGQKCIAIGINTNTGTYENSIAIGSDVISSSSNSAVIGNESVTSLKLGPNNFLLASTGLTFNEKPKLAENLIISAANDIVTKSYVDGKFDNIEIPDQDLTDYVNTNEVYKGGVRGSDIEIWPFNTSTDYSATDKSLNICGYITESPAKFVSLLGQVSKNYGIAIGSGSKVNNVEGGVSIGYNSAVGDGFLRYGSIALGYQAKCTGSNSITIGYGMTNDVADSIRIGNNSVTTIKLGATSYSLSSTGLTFNEQPKIVETLYPPTGNYDIVTKKYVDDKISEIPPSSGGENGNGITQEDLEDYVQKSEIFKADNCVVIGQTTIMSSKYGVAIGDGSKIYSNSNSGVAIGRNSNIGNTSEDNAANSISIGFNAITTGANTITIGANLNNATSNSIVIGTLASTSLKLGPNNFLLNGTTGMTFKEQPKIANSLYPPTGNNDIVTKKICG